MAAVAAPVQEETEVFREEAVYLRATGPASALSGSLLNEQAANRGPARTVIQAALRARTGAAMQDGTGRATSPAQGPARSQKVRGQVPLRATKQAHHTRAI